MNWNTGPLASYDCESTGLDPANDRIVTGALVRSNGQTLQWLSDVDGLDIPAAAGGIHGITTAHAQAHGYPAKQVTEEIAAAVAEELAAGAALVVMNAPFDLPMLDAECARHGVPTVAERIGRPIGPVVDPLLLDRTVDKYRKGSRKLEALAAYYDVKLAHAHEAASDAQAALDVALALARKYPRLRVPAPVLHERQVAWYAAWAEGYEKYLRKKDPTAAIGRSWPLIPAPDGEPGGAVTA